MTNYDRWLPRPGAQHTCNFINWTRWVQTITTTCPAPGIPTKPSCTISIKQKHRTLCNYFMKTSFLKHNSGQRNRSLVNILITMKTISTSRGWAAASLVRFSNIINNLRYDDFRSMYVFIIKNCIILHRLQTSNCCQIITGSQNKQTNTYIYTKNYRHRADRNKKKSGYV